MGRQLLILLVSALAGSTSIATSATAAPAELSVSPEAPIAGRPAVLTWVDGDGEPLDGARVVALYRPGSRVSTTEEIGHFSQEGLLTWRPREAGLVRLRAEGPDGTVVVRDVGVTLGRVSGTAIFVLVAAGGILVGGMLSGFLRRGREVVGSGSRTRTP